MNFSFLFSILIKISIFDLYYELAASCFFRQNFKANRRGAQRSPRKRNEIGQYLCESRRPLWYSFFSCGQMPYGAHQQLWNIKNSPYQFRHKKSRILKIRLFHFYKLSITLFNFSRTLVAVSFSSGLSIAIIMATGSTAETTVLPASFT